LFIVAAFPLLASTAQINSAHSTPFASVAFAGHTSMGGAYCTCGCDECICDPGDVPMACSRSTPNPDNGKGTTRDVPLGKAPTSQFDFGTGALMLALAFFVWARLARA
jgi:hypothetical protein